MGLSPGIVGLWPRISRDRRPAAARPGPKARMRQARGFPTRKGKSRHPLHSRRRSFRFGRPSSVKARGRSPQSDSGCQRQRLSFIPRGVCAGAVLKKRMSFQKLAGRAVPSKRSSPPAEKCRVCIGAIPLSQGANARKARFDGVSCAPALALPQRSKKTKGAAVLGGPSVSCRKRLIPPPAGPAAPRARPPLWRLLSRVPP